MSTSTTLTVRIDKQTRRQLEKLARATGRSKAFLTHHALKTYLEAQAWQIEAIHEGLRQADAGELVEHTAVKRKWEKKLARAMDRGGY
jgi:predicted transcriptional regulator